MTFIAKCSCSLLAFWIDHSRHYDHTNQRSFLRCSFFLSSQLALYIYTKIQFQLKTGGKKCNASSVHAHREAQALRQESPFIGKRKTTTDKRQWIFLSRWEFNLSQGRARHDYWRCENEDRNQNVHNNNSLLWSRWLLILGSLRTNSVWRRQMNYESWESISLSIQIEYQMFNWTTPIHGSDRLFEIATCKSAKSIHFVQELLFFDKQLSSNGDFP